MWKIPIARPEIGSEERQAVDRVLASGWLTRGPVVDRFEAALASYVGCDYGVAVNSGTSALMLALRSLGVGFEDEVITTSLTCTATVNAVQLIGATPVLVDVQPESLNLDPQRVREAITPKTKVLMPVHLFGRPAEMTQILDDAKEHDLPVVEDAAIALGSLYGQRRVGSLGTLAVYSFYANKHITTGEGGMVVCRSSELRERLLSLANLGKGTSPHMHDYIGYNFKMTEIQAALGLAQLEKVERFIQRRREVAARLTTVARERADVFESFADEPPGIRHTYFAFYFILRNPGLRRSFAMFLEQAGIETRPLFSYIPGQTPFAREGLNVELPVARDVYSRGLYITCGPFLSDDEVEYLCEAIRSFDPRKGA